MSGHHDHVSDQRSLQFGKVGAELAKFGLDRASVDSNGRCLGRAGIVIPDDRYQCVDALLQGASLSSHPVRNMDRRIEPDSRPVIEPPSDPARGLQMAAPKDDVRVGIGQHRAFDQRASLRHVADMYGCRAGLRIKGRRHEQVRSRLSPSFSGWVDLSGHAVHVPGYDRQR